MRGEKLLIARYLNYEEKIACHRNVKVNVIVSYPCISVRDICELLVHFGEWLQMISVSYLCIFSESELPVQLEESLTDQFQSIGGQKTYSVNG